MDLISNLPDSILIQVLSLLPTDFAASTCVLSKRWQFLWTMVYNLDLCCNISSCEYHPLGPGRTALKFVHFVIKFFTERDKDLSLKTFRLELHYLRQPCCSSGHVDKWLLAAMKCAIQELDFVFRSDQDFLFRCDIYACKTLVVLKLHGGIVVDAPPSSVLFPSLKILHLSMVQYANHQSFSNLFYGCPNLEKLDFKKSSLFGKLSNYVISSRTLRELSMYLNYGLGTGRHLVEAPSLEYLHLSLSDFSELYLKNLGNLNQADVCTCNYYFSAVDVLNKSRMVLEDALVALYNVQVLKLDWFMLKDRDSDAPLSFIPIFRNLVQLRLKGYCCHWFMLLCLLQKAPFLLHLTIDMITISDEDYKCDHCDFLGFEAWVDMEVPKCFSNLRTSSFNDFDFGYKKEELSCDDMEFVKFVLKNSIALEDIQLSAGVVYNPIKSMCVSFFGKGVKEMSSDI